MSLGRYLGPLLDIGPAMTAKILKRNGNTTHVSTYRALTDEEVASELEAQDRQAFTESISKRLGPEASMKGLKEKLVMMSQLLRLNPMRINQHQPIQSQIEMNIKHLISISELR